jgi:1-acyl-sn-glycerol-3-phosphate acyltransferase
MGTVIMLLCFASLLLFWDVQLKMMQALSRPIARRHLDRCVWRMAHRLLSIARHYGGLTVELNRRIMTDVPSRTVVCANHQSLADIVVLFDALRRHTVRFVAKKELSHGFPAVSEVLRIQRHALINRKGEYREGARQLHRLGRAIRAGAAAVVFPEGTRSRTGEVHEFHVGGIRAILAEALVPITAIAIDGGYRFTSFTDTIGGLSTITYRASLVGVYDHDGTKQSILRALKQAEAAVRAQIALWRKQP